MNNGIFSNNAFQNASAPRRISALVYCHILFGEQTQQLGWVLFGWGLLFFWVFAGNADWTSSFLFQGELKQAPGIVIDATFTGASVRSQITLTHPVRAYRYSFAAPDGGHYDGISYSDEGKQLQKGDTVFIEFPKGNPKVSRIQGMRRAVFKVTPSIIITIVLPIVGLSFLLPGLVKGIRTNCLLKHGELTVGGFKSTISMRTKILKREFYEILFNAYTKDGKSCEVVVRRNMTWTDAKWQEMEPLVLFVIANPY